MPPGGLKSGARDFFAIGCNPRLAKGKDRCFPAIMLGNLIGPEIKELIQERNFAALREAFSDWAPADVAECLTELPEGEQAIVFRLLPHAMATCVFEYLDTEAQEKVLKAMGHIEA